MKIRIVFTTAMLLIAFHAQSQTFLKGKIIDAKNGLGVPYANVSVETEGIASDENGEFNFKIPATALHQQMKISCVGYLSKKYSIDSLFKFGQRVIIFNLPPFSVQLKEIEVLAKKVNAVDVVAEALKKIPENYYQKPFNMDFYSKITVREGKKIHYTIEAIVNSYRAGYVEGAENSSLVSQKRISGINPLGLLHDKKRKIDFFSHERLPTFDIFLVDMIGVGKKYDFTVFNPDYFKKLNFTGIDISSFEGDTVNVVAYSPKGEKQKKQIQDTLFISSKTLAIVKHVRTLGNIRLEINYRKWGNNYFPYFVKTVYPTKEKNISYLVIHEAYIQRIKTERVTEFPKENKSWHLDDVAYDSAFWFSNYPAKK